MADHTATSSINGNRSYPVPPQLPLIDTPIAEDGGVGTTAPAANMSSDGAVTVMVSYIVSLLKAGNGIYLQDIKSPTKTTKSKTSASRGQEFCMYSTSMNQLEGTPPTSFMPMGDDNKTKDRVHYCPMEELSESTSPARPQPSHVDPFSDTVCAAAVPVPRRDKVPSQTSFLYDPTTSVFPEKARMDRAVVWGLLENGSSASPLGEYASPTTPSHQDPTNVQPTQEPTSQTHADFILDPAHAPGGLFPNGPGLLWTLELITTERAVSTLNDSEWSTISKYDVMMGNALQSEIDFVTHKSTIKEGDITNAPNETSTGTVASASSDKQQLGHQPLLHNSSSSATFASSATPGGQTNVTEEAGQRSSDASPFYDDNNSNSFIRAGSSFDAGSLSQSSKPHVGGMGLRHGSSLTDMPLSPPHKQHPSSTSLATFQHQIANHPPHHAASAGSLEVEALTINHHQVALTTPQGGSTSPSRGDSQPTEDDGPITTASSVPPRPLWSKEAILKPTPYDIQCIDIFEDLVRSLYAERIHNPNPDIQRVCASAVVGSAVLLFLRYIHIMGGDCAAEYHRFCCENIITPEQLSEAGGESHVLLPNSNVTWQPACWVPPSIAMLRQRRFDMSASLRAALQVVRVFHDGYRIQTSGSQIHLGQYRLHLLRTLNYDVTVVPPHAYIDGLCCSHAAHFVLNDLGKTGSVDHGVLVSSPGNFLRSVRTNIDTAIQHTSLVTSCRHVSWIAAAAIAEALLWFTTVVMYFEDATVESGLDGDTIMEAAMIQYNLNKVVLFQSIHTECGPAAAFYVKKAVDTMYILRTRTN